MKFRTEIIIPPSDFKISHQDKMMMIGSCFVESISEKLKNSAFRADVNPFGIMYNPISVLMTLKDILKRKEYTSDDLFFHQEQYHSFSHHSRFSGTNKEAVINNINDRIKTANDFISNADYLFVTFGTSSVYYQTENKQVVANCHKLPAMSFVRKRIPVEEIVEQWHDFIIQLREINPKIKLIFTISPIRHWKDGAHENQISKSVLFLAVDKLMQNSEVYYFPSYELIMDDLRDYRFYAEDMLHPNSSAIDYIWEKFVDTYFASETKQLIKEWESIRQALNHRPFNPDSQEYKRFIEDAKKREAAFLEKIR